MIRVYMFFDEWILTIAHCRRKKWWHTMKIWLYALTWPANKPIDRNTCRWLSLLMKVVQRNKNWEIPFFSCVSCSDLSWNELSCALSLSCSYWINNDDRVNFRQNKSTNVSLRWTKVDVERILKQTLVFPKCRGNPRSLVRFSDTNEDISNLKKQIQIFPCTNFSSSYGKM